MRAGAAGGRFARYRRQIDAVIESLIAEARSGPASGRRDDVLALLLGARDDNGEPMPDGHIADELLTLLIAGHESTSTLPARTVERMRRHPRLLARLTEEADAGGSELRRATILEAQRSRPVVDATLRRSKKRIRLGDWVIPEGHDAPDQLAGGGIGVGGEVDGYTLDDWYDVFGVNPHGVVHGIQAVYPAMIRQRFGHIVNTASMAGLITTVSPAGYTASKHAVVALSKTLRLEAERHGVRVSVLCPGVIRTPILTGGAYGRNGGVSDADLLRPAEKVRPMAPDAFAERALRAALRNDAIIVVPAWWKALWYLERLSPRPVDVGGQDDDAQASTGGAHGGRLTLRDYACFAFLATARM